MQNKTIGQPAPARASGNIGRLRKSLAGPKGEGQPNAIPGANDELASSGIGDHQLNRDNGMHMFERTEGSFQSVYDEVLAKGREAGYRQGYREGFSDGYKLGQAAAGAATALDTSAADLNKASPKCVIRLRGLPCANCGRCSYSDEPRCPGCGAAKVRAAERYPAEVKEPAESS